MSNAPTLAVTAVDEEGLLLSDVAEDRALDVLFDDRRIWSFWSLRDTAEEAPDRPAERRIAWPDRMRRFLDGATRLSVRDHVAGTVLHDEETTFGAGEGRIAFVNKQGLPVALDKSGRFHPEFSVRSGDQLEPLLEAMHRVIAVLEEEGIAAFPAYGTLLGAVREQDFLGHDSDADLGYVSRHGSPVDVVRESFRLQRALAARGMATFRYSGGAFRIDVEESDGSVRGLDLFGGFFAGDGKLYLMGEVGVDFREEWILPLSTVTLAGHEFPAPAEPERLLEAMYGPHWRVPDPAFKFETSAATKARLDNWFRGLSPYRREWQTNRDHRKGPVDAPASDLARRLAAAATPDTHVLDVGAGRGSDALHLARQGFRTTAYDYVPQTLRKAERRAGREGAPLEVRTISLTQLRSVLAEGARVAREQGPRAVLARHVLDATTERGREGLLRFAAMALRGGGRLYAEFATGAGETDEGLYPVPLDSVLAEIDRFGGSVLSADVEPGTQDRAGRAVVVAQW
ncbi:methyltransferase domain-containing protein [Nocardioides sp. BYT-33-1]|uniref:methyltransferase domain-containing protein n=1 Tax=Nocardioides sp. BYT-33-1 TaxID=3416952 RepID=UPI003F530A40